MRGLILMLAFCGVGFGQALNFTPPAVGYYVYNGSSWEANSDVGSGPNLLYTPSPVGIYCSANGTTWVPCAPPGTSTPTGPAGGDLGGTYPDPTVVSVANVNTGVLGIDYMATNPSTTFWINNQSTYAGTPDGTPNKPFTTVADAFNAMTQNTQYTVIFIGGGTYSEPAFTWPTAPTAVTVFGNQSIYSVSSGTVTATTPLVFFEMYLTGGEFDFAPGALPSRLWGGAIFGSTTISGNVVFHGTQFSAIFGSATVTVADNSTAVFDGSLMSANIVSSGAGSIVTIKGHVQMSDTVDGQANIDMSAGGKLNLFESQLTNTGSAANVLCDDGATQSSPNLITAGTSGNNGISCGGSWTNLSLATEFPSLYGSTNIHPTSNFALGTAGTIDVSGCALTTPVGGSAAGQFNSGTTGTCTVTVTSGYIAPNGWFVHANDLTTSADILHQTGSTQTTATFSGTTVTGDLINFVAVPY